MMPIRILIVCLAALPLLIAGCDRSTEAPASASNGAASATNQPTASPVNPAFAKLTGKWERGDGGYLLEIKSVQAGGKLEAAYFNPSPIHVSKAMVLGEGTSFKVFVELQDTGYPGCTYSLQYDATTDQLFGQYFQAAQQQTYDVAFGRVKD